MKLQHPHTEQVIEVPDADADSWRESGWLDIEASAEPTAMPTELTEATPRTKAATRTKES